MQIHVTQEHIDEGERAVPECCPIALAGRDATGQPCTVGFRWFQKWDGPPHRVDWQSVSLRLPKKAREFVLAFDAGEPVQPFTFELNV